MFTYGVSGDPVLPAALQTDTAKPFTVKVMVKLPVVLVVCWLHSLNLGSLVGFLACLGKRERFFSPSWQIFHLSQTSVAETASMVRQGKVGKQEQGLSDTTKLLDPQEEKWGGKRTLVPFALRINNMGMTNCSSRFFILI